MAQMAQQDQQAFIAQAMQHQFPLKPEFNGYNFDDVYQDFSGEDVIALLRNGFIDKAENLYVEGLMQNEILPNGLTYLQTLLTIGYNPQVHEAIIHCMTVDLESPYTLNNIGQNAFDFASAINHQDAINGALANYSVIMLRHYCDQGASELDDFDTQNTIVNFIREETERLVADGAQDVQADLDYFRQIIFNSNLNDACKAVILTSNSFPQAHGDDMNVELVGVDAEALL